MKSRVLELVFFALVLTLAGCGLNDLPEMRTQARAPFKELMIHYRLRSDVAIKLARMVEKQYPDLARAVQESQSKAMSVELSLDNFDERQANRFQSFQNFLSRDVAQLISKVESQGKGKSFEFQSLKGQFERLDGRVLLLKREYLKIANSYNQTSQKFPHSLYNRWKHHLEPLPEIGVLAKTTGGQ